MKKIIFFLFLLFSFSFTFAALEFKTDFKTTNYQGYPGATFYTTNSSLTSDGLLINKNASQGTGFYITWGNSLSHLNNKYITGVTITIDLYFTGSFSDGYLINWGSIDSNPYKGFYMQPFLTSSSFWTYMLNNHYDGNNLVINTGSSDFSLSGKYVFVYQDNSKLSGRYTYEAYKNGVLIGYINTSSIFNGIQRFIGSNNQNTKPFMFRNDSLQHYYIKGLSFYSHALSLEEIQNIDYNVCLGDCQKSSIQFLSQCEDPDGCVCNVDGLTYDIENNQECISNNMIILEDQQCLSDNCFCLVNSNVLQFGGYCTDGTINTIIDSQSCLDYDGCYCNNNLLDFGNTCYHNINNYIPILDGQECTDIEGCNCYNNFITGGICNVGLENNSLSTSDNFLLNSIINKIPFLSDINGLISSFLFYPEFIDSLSISFSTFENDYTINGAWNCATLWNCDYNTWPTPNGGYRVGIKQGVLSMTGLLIDGYNNGSTFETSGLIKRIYTKNYFLTIVIPVLIYSFSLSFLYIIITSIINLFFGIYFLSKKLLDKFILDNSKTTLFSIPIFLVPFSIISIFLFRYLVPLINSINTGIKLVFDLVYTIIYIIFDWIYPHSFWAFDPSWLFQISIAMVYTFIVGFISYRLYLKFSNIK